MLAFMMALLAWLPLAIRGPVYVALFILTLVVIARLIALILDMIPFL